MLARLIELFRENRAVRDFTVTGLMIICGGVVASHILATGLAGASGAIASLSTPAKQQPQQNIVTRQIIRSVLDDDIVTGTTSKPSTIILDPCTGEQKLPSR